MLQRVVSLGLEQEQVQRSVSNNKHNNFSTSYYLVYQKMLRQNELTEDDDGEYQYEKALRTSDPQLLAKQQSQLSAELSKKETNIDNLKMFLQKQIDESKSSKPGAVQPYSSAEQRQYQEELRKEAEVIRKVEQTLLKTQQVATKTAQSEQKKDLVSPRRAPDLPQLPQQAQDGLPTTQREESPKKQPQKPTQLEPKPADEPESAVPKDQNLVWYNNPVRNQKPEPAKKPEQSVAAQQRPQPQPQQIPGGAQQPQQQQAPQQQAQP